MTGAGATTVTVLADGVATVRAEVSGGRVVVSAADLPGVLGWTLRPEGLCHGDLCVPVRDRSLVEAGGGRVDLIGVAAALDRPVLFDGESSVLALGAPRADRRAALVGRRAPAFELPDLDGTLHRSEEWRDRRMVLVAFASW